MTNRAVAMPRPAPGNGVRQPVRIVVHARVRGADGETVAERAAHPAVLVVAGLGKHRPDRECGRRMHRRKRLAVAAPIAFVGSDVRPLASRDFFETRTPPRR